MKECHSSVFEPRRSKISSSKQIVGECKYYSVPMVKSHTHSSKFRTV